MSSSSTLAVLTLVPVFGLAVWTTYGQFIMSDTLNLLLDPPGCPWPPEYRSSSQLHYTGLAPIDYFGCVAAEMMKNALVAQNQRSTIHQFSNFVSPIMVLNIEGLRSDGPSRWYPFAVTLLSMCSNAGVAFPIGWLYLLIAHRQARKPLTRESAEAVFLSLIFGWLLPSAIFIITVDEYAILFWNFYIFYIIGLQALWLYIRPPTSSSGFFTTQSALFTAFIVSAAVHLTMLVTNIPQANTTSLDYFRSWFPPWIINDPKSLTTENAILYFLRWDAIWTYVGTAIAGYLFTDSWPELLLYTMATPMIWLCLGPGAVIAAMWMWREWKLTMLQEVELATVKAQDKKEE